MSGPQILYVAVYDSAAVNGSIEELDELYRRVVVAVSGVIDNTALIQHIGMLRGMALFHETFNGVKSNTNIEVVLAESTITDIDAGKYHVIAEIALTDPLVVQQSITIVRQAISNYTLLYGDGEDALNRTIRNTSVASEENGKTIEDDIGLFWNSFLALFNNGGITEVLPWPNRLNPAGALSMIPQKPLYRRSALGGVDFTTDCSAALVFYTGKSTVKNYGVRYLKSESSIDKNGLIELYNLLELLDCNSNLDALRGDLTVGSIYSFPVPVPAATATAGSEEAQQDANGNLLSGLFNPFNFDPREYYPQSLDPRTIDPRQALNPLNITNKLVVLPLTSTVNTIGTWINGDHNNGSVENTTLDDSGNNASQNEEEDSESEGSSGSFLIGLMEDNSITKKKIYLTSNGELKPFQVVLYLFDDHLFAILYNCDSPSLSSAQFYEDLAMQFDSSLGMVRSVMTLNSLHDLVVDPNILFVICNTKEGSMRTSLPFLGPPAITYLHEQLIQLGTETSSSDIEFLHKFRSNKSNDWTIYRITYNNSIIFILRNHHRGNAMSTSTTNRTRQNIPLPVITLAEGLGLFETLGDDVKLWLTTLEDYTAQQQ